MKATEKLEDYLISIYQRLDGFYPDSIPNEINSIHYDGGVSVMKLSDYHYSFCLSFLTTTDEAVRNELESESDEDSYEVDDIMYDSCDIDLRSLEATVELAIEFDIEYGEIDFEQTPGEYGETIDGLSDLESILEKDENLINLLTESAVSEFPEAKSLVRNRNIDSLLAA